MVKLEDFKIAEIKKMISKYNKEVKITTSGLKKADLIKKIREHPRLTVTESDKGVNIKVKSDTTIGGKKIKIKKDEKPEEKPKAELGQSGIGKKRKRVSKPGKKKVIDVAVEHESDEEEEKPKPKVPTITVTEAEKPKRKVIKRGGRFITVKPKEPKADLPPILKPKTKIRVAPKKEKAKKEESDEEDEEPKINVKLLSARARVKSLKQQLKDFKEEGKSTKRIEKELRMAELKLSKIKK